MNYIDNVYVINMDKSTDRMVNIKKQEPILGKKITRIPAIDGKSLSKEEINLNSTGLCSSFCSNSMIGCFLSHKKAWQSIVDNGDEYAIIMEDDCELIKDTNGNFQIELKKLLDELIPSKPDFIYLGCFGACDPSKKYSLFEFISMQTMTKIKQSGKKSDVKNKYSFVPESPVGFHCYIISNSAAKKLINYMPKADFHVDVTFLNYADNFKVYAASKQLAFQAASTSNSTQTTSFPNIINSLLDKCKTEKGVSIGYYFSCPLFVIGNYNITFLYIIYLLLVLSLRVDLFVLFLLLEYTLNPEMYKEILFWSLPILLKTLITLT